MGATHLATNALPNTAGRARRVRNPISQEELDRLTSKKSYLVNITERDWNVQRTYGVYVIQPAPEGREYSVLEISGRIEATDEGNDNALQWKHEAQEIADDVAREINDRIMAAPTAKSFMGVFVSPTAIPSAKELDAAKKKLRAFQRALVDAANRFWDDPKTHREVNELHRWAGRALKVTAPWLFDAEELVECPACAKGISAGVAICPNCDAILDEAKARKYFPHKFQNQDAPARRTTKAKADAA